MKINVLTRSSAFAMATAALASVSAGTMAQDQGPDVTAVIAADANLTSSTAALRVAELAETLRARDIANGQPRMPGGGRVDLIEKDGSIFFGEYPVLAADRDASNGMVYVVDAVVLPE